MAFNAFLQINSPTVAGEATQNNFAAWIEIYSFSWGASNPTTVSSGQAGLSAGKVSISSFNVMKKADVSSPPLFAACSAGQHYGGAVVNLLKATGVSGEQQIFWTYTFTDVMVESIQWSGSSGGDDTPTESVSFAFAKVQVDYFKQDTATGSMTNSGTASWDLTKTSKGS
jgi:type VI secretion system secreted protein Hcp